MARKNPRSTGYVAAKIRANTRAKRNGAYEKRTGRRWDPVAQAGLVERSFETLPNGAPRYYFSLHEVDRFGVNPRAEYGTTPLGVYAYPLTPQYLALLLSRGLPYAEDAEHVTLVEAVKPDRLLYLGLRRLGGCTSPLDRPQRSTWVFADSGTPLCRTPAPERSRNEPAQAVFLVPSAYRVGNGFPEITWLAGVVLLCRPIRRLPKPLSR